MEIYSLEQLNLKVPCGEAVEVSAGTGLRRWGSKGIRNTDKDLTSKGKHDSYIEQLNLDEDGDVVLAELPAGAEHLRWGSGGSWIAGNDFIATNRQGSYVEVAGELAQGLLDRRRR